MASRPKFVVWPFEGRVYATLRFIVALACSALYTARSRLRIAPVAVAAGLLPVPWPAVYGILPHRPDSVEIDAAFAKSTLPIMSSQLLDDLRARDLIFQIAGEEAIAEWLSAEPRTLYCGL